MTLDGCPGAMVVDEDEVAEAEEDELGANEEGYQVEQRSSTMQTPRAKRNPKVPNMQHQGATAEPRDRRSSQIRQNENLGRDTKKWGCSEDDINKVFSRQPSLRKANGSVLESKLNFLSELGVRSSDLVKMINCRPQFLNCRLNRYFEARVEELRTLFGLTELFLKAIVRNPPLLMYDFEKTVKSVISLYEGMGINRSDLISMLLSQPTLFSRTNMSEEKLDYIRRMGVSKESKLYKYVVTIMVVSRIETICEKVTNLEKFGFSEDRVLQLFGRSPLLMMLSLDKAQRNITFVLGTMNLEVLLEHRVLLARKMQGMGLSPRIDGPKMFGALRMSEQRFLKVNVMCHEENIKDELLDYYRTTKRVK
ncbi:hypothetical protein Cgig2_018955 [Carnegiea gigantea]|uniref:Uncharacterized protein n=1 Tax=Carnegiea gigantea TaxID=171969 RepID=A0A9Q1GUR6_9CARY|nr:hypothetical protein Cgig2_018955 [Carnegiea gigantea]